MGREGSNSKDLKGEKYRMHWKKMEADREGIGKKNYNQRQNGKARALFLLLRKSHGVKD